MPTRALLLIALALGVLPAVPSRAAGQWEVFEETTIRGTISGTIRRGHVFETTSGNIYEVADYAYEYVYEYQPDVIVLRNGSVYRLLISGVDDPLECRRLNGEQSADPALAVPAEPVSYFQSSVARSEGDRLYLVDGSEWLLTMDPLLPIMVGREVIGVLDQVEGYTAAYFYSGRETHAGLLVDGMPAATSGEKTWVSEVRGDGAVLRTGDGRLWRVPEYDQYDTGFWLAPYDVIISANELYMLNLEQGRRIWVEPLN